MYYIPGYKTLFEETAFPIMGHSELAAYFIIETTCALAPEMIRAIQWQNRKAIMMHKAFTVMKVYDKATGALNSNIFVDTANGYGQFHKMESLNAQLPALALKDPEGYKWLPFHNLVVEYLAPFVNGSDMHPGGRQYSEEYFRRMFTEPTGSIVKV